MKKAVISYPNSLNLGDEIQSIAAMRLIENVEHFIDRENLHSFKSSEQVKLLCNGWFMGNPMHWPPADSISSLFISMHISKANGSAEKMFTERSIAYFKKHAPIGCRDKGTLALFKKHGIEAYFSNCLTLTLENKFEEKRTNKILLVDAFRTNYDQYYREFNTNNMVPENLKHNVEIIQQKSKAGLSVDERFKAAEDLIEKYSTAKLVITSRIHCAIPCLALGTPVYFVHAGYHKLSEGLEDRFDGLLEMFNILDEKCFKFGGNSLLHRISRKLKLYRLLTNSSLDIDWENPKANTYDFSEHKKLMKNNVEFFFSQP